MRLRSLIRLTFGLIVAVSQVDAALVLTPAGVSDNFTLTTFVSGYSAQYGPLAQGIATDGNVITGSELNSRIYVFKDVDGQTLASAISSNPYTFQTSNPNFAMTTANGQVYGAQLQGGVYEHFNSDGSFTPIAGLTGVTNYLGMWGNPTNGHIIAASSKGLVDIDPIAGSYRVINAGLFPDGVTVSPDGVTAYIENAGTIQSYNIATGALIKTFNTGHSPDGTGVIIGGQFNGDVIVNDNDGTVGLLDPTKAAGDPTQFVIIASGGTRGDFVSPDTSNGTLFLSQTDQVARLSCGADCSIGVTLTPEPGTFLLLGTGFVGVFFVRRRRS